MYDSTLLYEYNTNKYLDAKGLDSLCSIYKDMKVSVMRGYDSSIYNDILKVNEFFYNYSYKYSNVVYRDSIKISAIPNQNKIVINIDSMKFEEVYLGYVLNYYSLYKLV